MLLDSDYDLVGCDNPNELPSGSIARAIYPTVGTSCFGISIFPHNFSKFATKPNKFQNFWTNK